MEGDAARLAPSSSARRALNDDEFKEKRGGFQALPFPLFRGRYSGDEAGICEMRSARLVPAKREREGGGEGDLFLVFPPPSVPTAPNRTGAILLLGWQVKRRSIHNTSSHIRYNVAGRARYSPGTCLKKKSEILHFTFLTLSFISQ